MSGAAPRTAAVGALARPARRRWVRALGAAAVLVAAASVAIGAARRGLFRWSHVRAWYSEETTSFPALQPTALPAERPRVECSGLAVLVLDDHPVARRVADALSASLARAAGGEVPVHDASAAPFAPGEDARVDVLALVDLVHLDAEDWLVYQRCQVRLNVALGRPARAVDEGRGPAQWGRAVVDERASFGLEYSVDGHWEVIGLAAGGEHFAAAAHSIAADLDAFVAALDWTRQGREALTACAPLRELPTLAPAGQLQRIYAVVRPDGAREALLQFTTDGDWISEVERLEAAALGLGWRVVTGARHLDGRPMALVLELADERLELALAYMQGTLRAASEQRQVLTCLRRRGLR